MKILIILLLAVSTTALKCRGTLFNNKYYDTEIHKDGLNNARQMVYHRRYNTVYFVYDQAGIPPSGSVGYFNLDTHQAGFFIGIRNASSIAIDTKRNRLYIGSEDGLYAVTDNNLPEKFPIYEPILSLYFKDVLYFTNLRKKVYKFDNGGVTVVPEMKFAIADELMVDDDNNMFFLNNKVLYRAKLGAGSSIFEITNMPVNVIATDIDHKLYAATKDGVYLYNRYKYALDNISSIRDIKALSFNAKLEPIYVVYDLLFRLRNPVDCVEDEPLFV